MEIRDWRLETGDWNGKQSRVSSLQLTRLSRSTLLFILLIAFFLRVHLLTEIPPGLTHDEANHGREAIGILQGNLALFFPLNYGSEPLYSYTVAGLMALIGPGLLALRLVTVYVGLLALSATTLFGRLAFGRSVALLGAGLMALSFWPLASSREALRAGMMPFFTAGALIFFRLLLQRARGKGPQATVAAKPTWVLALGLTLCIAATLYNYLAARVLWLVFPTFLIYLLVTHKDLLQRLWRPTLAALALTALLVTPMFIYLQQHPEAQTRLQMFGVLSDLMQGNIGPVLQKAANALLAFGWPGMGDRFLAYNLPGRPVLMPLTALFFVLGLGVCLWRWRRPSYGLLLIWYVVGVTPSLLTGATANTTRNVGAMPATFLLPAVGFVALACKVYQWAHNTRARGLRWAVRLFVVVWLAWVGWRTATDYFDRWAQAPEVRAAYMQTLVQQLAYVASHPRASPAVISSVLPGPAHNQSIGLVLSQEAHDLRWIDARRALILPPQEATVLIPASTPPHVAFEEWLQPLEIVRLRDDDLDPYFTTYDLQTAPDLPRDPQEAAFGQVEAAITLLGSRWLTTEVRAGEEVDLLQVWRVEDATGVGPDVTALGGNDVVLFTHVLDGSGQIVAQEDRLDAPSTSWRTGDVILQVHRLSIPQEMAPGTYTTVAGLYDRASRKPLPALEGAGRWDATRAQVDSLNIIP